LFRGHPTIVACKLAFRYFAKTCKTNHFFRYFASPNFATFSHLFASSKNMGDTQTDTNIIAFMSLDKMLIDIKTLVSKGTTSEYLPSSSL
jgi:hypothetical protein